MVEHIMDRVSEGQNLIAIVTIIGHGARNGQKQQLGDRRKYTLQAEQLGTGHAVIPSRAFLKREKRGTTLVIQWRHPFVNG